MTDDTITLYATIRNAFQHDERRQIEASGNTYEEARKGLWAQIPNGWQILGIAHWPLA